MRERVGGARRVSLKRACRISIAVPKSPVFGRDLATRSVLSDPNRQHDVTPKKIQGTGKRTWHGLNTERELFERMGMQHVYELDYAWLSDEAHVNIGAVTEELVAALEGRTGFGPTKELPREVLWASSYSIPEVLAQLSNLLGLGLREEILAMRDESRAAVRLAYGATSRLQMGT